MVGWGGVAESLRLTHHLFCFPPVRLQQSPCSSLCWASDPLWASTQGECTPRTRSSLPLRSPTSPYTDSPPPSLPGSLSYAINFARDFGPRLFLSLIGYPRTLFTHNSYWCLWGPGLASMIGGLLGGGMYDVCVYTGEDSPVNRVGRGQVGELVLESGEEEEEGEVGGYRD